jgi:hypothetical protein
MCGTIRGSIRNRLLRVRVQSVLEMREYAEYDESMSKNSHDNIRIYVVASHRVANIVDWPLRKGHQHQAVHDKKKSQDNGRPRDDCASDQRH